MEDYTIEKRLGKGAFGETYKALNNKDGKAYAIKKYRPRKLKTSEDIFRYNKEIEHELKVMHLILTICNDVAPCYKDSFIHDTNFYIIMDLINGWTVEEGCYGKKRIPLAKRTGVYKSIILDLVYGLQKLHNLGLAHQDIKSANLMFDVPSRRFKFIDFGLSCVLDEGIPTGSERAYSTFFKHRPCAVPGNMLCLAPEMIDVKTTRPRGGETYPETWIKAHDIWSIGCVLLTWFTLRDDQEYDKIEESLYFGYQFTRRPENYESTFQELKTSLPHLYYLLMITFQRDPYARVLGFNQIRVQDIQLHIPDYNPTWNQLQVTETAIENQKAWKASIKTEDTNAYEENEQYEEEEIAKIRKVTFSDPIVTSAVSSTVIPEALPIGDNPFSDLLNNDLNKLFAEYDNLPKQK